MGVKLLAGGGVATAVGATVTMGVAVTDEVGDDKAKAAVGVVLGVAGAVGAGSGAEVDAGAGEGDQGVVGTAREGDPVLDAQLASSTTRSRGQ